MIDIKKEARKIRIGICACGGDYTCTQHDEIAAFGFRVADEAREEAARCPGCGHERRFFCGEQCNFIVDTATDKACGHRCAVAEGEQASKLASLAPAGQGETDDSPCPDPRCNDTLGAMPIPQCVTAVAWAEKADKLKLQVAKLERFSIFAPNSCSVCGGAPLASGRECICGGKGTAHAETDGLRQELFTIENRASSPAPDKGEVARRLAHRIVTWIHGDDPEVEESVASIIEAELKESTPLE